MKKDQFDNDISFLGKVFLFFRSVKERLASLALWTRLIDSRKARAGYEGAESPREARLSYGFDMVRLLAILLLCLFLGGVLLFAGGIISYENVYYMFKDIGYINSFSESHPATLNYSKPFNSQSFASYKSGLAVAGDSEIKFFTSGGRMTMTRGSDYTDPVIATSDTHALIYDRGSRSFAIYNSFIEVFSGTVEQPISTAFMSDSGAFCIVTEAKSHGSAVHLYSADFHKLATYSKNDYVISATLSANGKYLAVLSLDAANGESLVSLNVLRVGQEELYSETKLYGWMPYTAAFTANDRIVLICDKLVLTYDLKGNLKEQYDYPDRLTDFAVTSTGFALAFSGDGIGGKGLLAVFDENGRLRLAKGIDGHIKDLCLGTGYAYLLQSDRVLRVDLSGGSLSEVDFHEEDASLLLLENGELMACTPGTAYYIGFGLTDKK